MFEFKDGCLLESQFGPEIGSAVAAVAASMIAGAAINVPYYFTSVLEPLAAKLQAILSNLDDMHSVDRRVVLYASGLLEFAIGENSDDRLRIERALNLFKEATTTLSRDRVPLTWALSQNSLGSAFGPEGGDRAGNRPDRGSERSLSGRARRIQEFDQGASGDGPEQSRTGSWPT